jgi:hypothetical protein
MVTAYLDTCVFDNLLKRNGFGGSHLSELRAAIGEKRLAIVANILNLQETLDAINSATPGIVVQQIKFIARLVDWDRFVKPCDMLLTDDIRHFSWCGEAANPLLAPQIVRVLRAATFDLIDGKMRPEELDDVVREDFQQKKKFADILEENHAQTAPQVEQLRDQGVFPAFPEFFDVTASSFAVALARKGGRADECENRGLEGFLAVRSVRMAVGHAMSIVYRRAFENRKLRRSLGTSRDLQHSPCAAASADLFVTHDRELAELVRRVPMRRFRVCTLRELLDELRMGEPATTPTAA